MVLFFLAVLTSILWLVSVLLFIVLIIYSNYLSYSTLGLEFYFHSALCEIVDVLWLRSVFDKFMLDMDVLLTAS